jgi:hypothetical protein
MSYSKSTVTAHINYLNSLIQSILILIVIKVILSLVLSLLLIGKINCYTTLFLD